MQLTMNNDCATVSVSDVNRLSWIDAITKKVAGLFKKKTHRFTYGTIAEAIQFVEWRTKYNQQRIVQYIHTASFKNSNPELYVALGMGLPVKQVVSNETVNIEITDNSFERRLLKFFGNLRSETRALLNGEETENKKKIRENADLNKMLSDSIETKTISYESLLLQEFAGVLNAIQVAINETPKVRQPNLLALSAAKEPIEVAVETLPTKFEATIQKEAKRLSTKMTIPELKAHARTLGIKIPGRITRHKAIYQYIKLQSRN